MLTDFHWDEAKKNQKKNSKWPTQKNNVFQNRQFSIFFCENFRVVGLIDVKGIDVAQPLWP